MSAPDLYVADLTTDEELAGFEVCLVVHPDGPPATLLAAVHSCDDPSHRLIKTRGRDGIIFQLQAFGRPPAGARPLGWYAERYWPSRYGPAWVLERLREYLGRPGYRPLIDLHVPPPAIGAVVPTTPTPAQAAAH